ncbi:hypothetical protein LB565_27870 [Mesorhizobium sp. CA14]|nr:hypothetical protein [Mesorhizobium sp. CA14]
METWRAGPLGGKTVVSMRPIERCYVEQVRAFTARFPNARDSRCDEQFRVFRTRSV